MNENYDMYDMEQQIMNCWAITTDLDVVYENITGMTEDAEMNVILGMKELYNLKFDKLFRMHEVILKKHCFLVKDLQAELKQAHDQIGLLHKHMEHMQNRSNEDHSPFLKEFHKDVTDEQL